MLAAWIPRVLPIMGLMFVGGLLAAATVPAGPESPTGWTARVGLQLAFTFLVGILALRIGPAVVLSGIFLYFVGLLLFGLAVTFLVVVG